MSLLALALATGMPTLEPSAGRAPLECANAVDGEMRSFPLCEWKDSKGAVHIARRRLGRLSVDRHRLTAVYVGGWRYVARNRRSAPVMTFDNGADPFADGLARSPVGDKVGYIDRRLGLAISVRFDGAYPFEHDLAAVCVGCRAVSDAEHASYVGGEWGYIDRQGRLVNARRRAARYAACPPILG